MGASRKLQGEIDRVLKKVQEGVDVFDSIWIKVHDTENANQKEKFEADLKKEIKKLQRYRDQIKTWLQSSEIKDKKALTDFRKLIEHEMERFKVCEKETKTKAFSKEGLGQQPKTDPKEKAKSETRDWLNGVVGDLESQKDSFEAEAEGLSVKKGKTKPPRLVHLEKSIARHNAHIKKLLLILRLLDNDELGPDEVNDIKDLLDDYVERNQDDFEDFEDVDDVYSTLPLEKVEVFASSSFIKAPVSSTTNSQEQSEDTASQDSNPDSVPTPPPTVNHATGSLASTSSGTVASSAPSITAASSSVQPVAEATIQSSVSSGPVSARAAPENIPTVVSSSLPVSTSGPKEDENVNVPVRKPAVASLGSDLSKRNTANADERFVGGGVTPPLASPMGKPMLQQVSRASDGVDSNETANITDGAAVVGRVFSPAAVVSGVPWRPQTAVALQNPVETGQLRVRPEISPDHREKYLQRFQQAQQQGHSSLLNIPPGVNQKQFQLQQPNNLLQQLNSPTITPQVGVSPAPSPGPGVSAATTIIQQQASIPHPSGQPPVGSNALKDGDVTLVKKEEQQHGLIDEGTADLVPTAGVIKNTSEDELKIPYPTAPSPLLPEANQMPRDLDSTSAQPLQSSMPSASVGVIGRKSVSDNTGSTSIGPNQDHIYNLQMLEAAYYKLPQPQDAERVKTYIPKHPTTTPASYPQKPVPHLSSPEFWERCGREPTGSDILFFAFYYQQGSYQQYLAARELKRQSWRYHRRYNTWFQRHEEPKVTNDEYERGSYVYFDFHLKDESGWCQRIRNDFTFEYSHLEDELV